MLNDHLVQYIAITETKIDNSFPDSQFIIPNYIMYRNDRNQYGGGVCTYIRSDIPNRRLTDIESVDLELIVNEVTINKERWIIIAAYRPQTTEVNVFLDEMQNVVDRCLTKSTNIIITGDLNLNLLDMRSESSPGMKLKNFMDIFDCQNMVRDPTCFAGNEPTSIDVIITNNGNKFAKTIACNTGLSDHHYMVASALKKHAPCVKNTDITYRSYRNLNVDAFRQDVESIPFSVCNVFDDINDSHCASIDRGDYSREHC